MFASSEKSGTGDLRSVVEKIQLWAVSIFFLSCLTRGVLLTHRILLGHSWVDGVLLVFGFISTLVFLSRRLPAQNWISIAALTALFSGAFEWALSDGEFVLPPITLPILWVIALLNARGTGQWMLRSWRASWGYGFWLIGITSSLTALFITAISILSGQIESEDSVWMSLLLRFAVACIILIINTTLLIVKSPTPRPLEKGHLTFWLACNLLAIVAAAIQGLWGVCLAGIVVNGAVYLLSRKKA